MKMSMDEKAGKITEAYLACIESEDADFGTMELLARFFDIDNRKNMDLKIEVLNRVADGDRAEEIYGFYDILDNYPGDGVKW